MPNGPLRFVHASDLHLDRPLTGLADVPQHLREPFLQAPYKALSRLCDVILEEQADFVVLAGDVVEPCRAGPRGLLTLLEQLERLAVRDIPVYWVGGQIDAPETWPAGFPLPANVMTFPAGRVEMRPFDKGARLVRLFGQSRDAQLRLRPADFPNERDGTFNVGIAHGDFTPEAFSGEEMHYWALGGLHQRETLRIARHVAHYSGSPQGRNPEEPGPHGCTLVEVDEDGQVRHAPRATDAVRFRDERIVLADEADGDGLETALAERVQRLAANAPGVDHLVRWKVAGAGATVDKLRRGGWASELLHQLRTRYGDAETSVWSLSLEAECADDAVGAAFRQDTLLGDFLRAISNWQRDDAATIDFAALLAAEGAEDLPPALVQVQDAPTRQRILSRAGALGLDMLTGEGSRW